MIARNRVLSLTTALAVAVLLSPGIDARANEVSTEEGFALNSYTTGNQIGSEVAAAADGSFVVVWTSEESGSDDPQLFARGFDADSLAFGPEVQLSSGGSVDTGPFESPQHSIHVAALAAGGFVVVWGEDLPVGHADSVGAILARRLDAQGSPLGTEFLVNVVTTNRQTRPRVAGLDDGNFVVAWEDRSPGELDADIKARVFDAAGTAVTGEFAVNAYTTGRQARVTLDSRAGGFVAAWQGDGTGTTVETILARTFDNAGTPGGADFQIVSGNTLLAYDADISTYDSGAFIVAWNEAGDIYLKGLDAAGLPTFSETLASGGTGSRTHPTVETRGNDGFLVAWHAGSAMRLRAYDSAGVPQFAAEPLTSSDAGSSSFAAPGLASADEHFVTTWTLSGGPSDGDGNGLHARRVCLDFGTDSDGDGVGDLCDTCPAGAEPFLSKTRIRMKFVGGGHYDHNERLQVSGEFVLDGGRSFGDLDPVNEPPRVLLSDGPLRAAMLDETLKPGLFSGGGTAGWKGNGAGTKWKYTDKTSAPANGIVTVRIDDRSKKAPGQIRIKLKGKKGNYTGVGPEYLNFSMVTGDTSLGQCAETAFTEVDCQSTGNGTRFGCDN